MLSLLELLTSMQHLDNTYHVRQYGGKNVFYVYEKINTTRCVYCVFRAKAFKVIEGQWEEAGTAQLVSVSVLWNMSTERVQIFRNNIFLYILTYFAVRF